MLSYETSSKLATLLLAISKGEQEIEIARQSLCNLIDFEPYAAFQRIRGAYTGAITADELRTFLAENRIFYSESECYIFIRQADNDKDSALSYAEFLSALLPTNNPLLRARATQRMNYKVSRGQTLALTVERALAKLIDMELSFYLNLDLQKARLSQQKGFTFTAAFSAIDKYISEALDFDNITSFLKGQAMYPDKENVIVILQRMSKDNTGLISYDEFVAEIEPLTDITRQSTVSVEPKEKRSFHQDNSYVSFALRKPNEVEVQDTPLKYDPSKYEAQNLKENQLIGSSSKSEKVEEEFSFTGTFRNSGMSNQAHNVQDSALKTTGGKDLLGNLTISTAAHSSDKNVSRHLAFSAQKEVVKGYSSYNEKEVNINFIRILKQWLAFTKELETARERLAMQSDFCVSAFFATFNPEDKVFVSESQLEAGFKKYGVFPRKEELQLLFRRLDRDQDGTIRAIDFEDMLLPKEHEIASFARTRDAFSIGHYDSQKAIDQV